MILPRDSTRSFVHVLLYQIGPYAFESIFHELLKACLQQFIIFHPTLNRLHPEGIREVGRHPKLHRDQFGRGYGPALPGCCLWSPDWRSHKIV
jgi:hypothetical protein